MTDYTFESHGSLWLCRPSTNDARAWLDDHVGDEAQWFGGALAVEPRYVVDLAAQLQNDGWTVGQ
jgi:hypothetical protein